jgi:hypothetical protein
MLLGPAAESILTTEGSIRSANAGVENDTKRTRLASRTAGFLIIGKSSQNSSGSVF